MSDSSAALRIDLSGDLTISSLTSVYERFVSAFAEDTPIEIYMDRDSDVDVSLVQLIESARNTAAQRGVTLALASPAEGQLLNTLIRGGFINDEPGHHSPFWQWGH